MESVVSEPTFHISPLEVLGLKVIHKIIIVQVSLLYDCAIHVQIWWLLGKVKKELAETEGW